ncbi:MAG: hypothetical protein ABIS20_18095 [Thermoanaerobaculia bacterium]
MFNHVSTKTYRTKFLLILLVGVLAALPLSAAPLPGQQGAGVAIGCFCMDGVRGTPHPNEDRQEIDGVWKRWTYSYSKGPGAGAARLFIFDRPVQPDENLLSCDEIAAKAQSAGTRLMLSGTLNSLEMNANVFQAVHSDNRFQVNENQLKAELGRVSSGSLRIGGGTLDLAGARLYIRLPARLLALAQRLEGSMEIEAWNRTLEGATFRLPGGSTFSTTLSPVDPQRENVLVRLDLKTGGAQLWRARLTGTPPHPLSMPSLHVAGLTLDEALLDMPNVSIQANSGKLTANLNDVAGTAKRATLTRPTVTTTLQSPELQWKLANSPVEASADELAMTALSLTDATFHGPDAEVRATGGLVALSGAAVAKFAKLSATEATGLVHWTHPEIGALPFLLPSGAVNGLDVEISGLLDRPRLRGSADAQRFAVGPLAIDHALPLAFDIAGGATELRFPLRVSLADPVGTGVALRDRDQAVALTATLTRADLDSTVVLAWPDLRRSRLEVPTDRFHLALGNTVATQPFLAGTAPTFGRGRLALSNFTPLVVGETSSGSLRLAANALILGQPILRVGDRGKESASTLKLEAKASVALGYDLATGKMSLRRGKLLADGVEFALLDPQGTIDLAGTLVTSPRLKVGQLSIEVDEEQTPRISRASLKVVEIGAARVARPSSPGHSNEVTFDATPVKPLSIDLLEAEKASVADAVDLQTITVHGIDFGLQNATARFGGGFNVDQARLSLRAKSITSVEEPAGTSYTFENASFAVSGRLSTTGQVHINGDTGFELALNVDGRSDRLNGSGQAKLEGFTGSASTDLPLTVACTLGLPIEYNFSAGGADLAVTAKDGDFAATADLGHLALLLHSKSGASCDSASEKHVISPEHEAWTTGVCVWPPRTCKWSVTVPEVSFSWHKRFEIHQLAATAVLTNPRLDLQGDRLRVCNLGVISLGPPVGALTILGDVSPQIDSAWPGADQIINPIISGFATLVESTTSTALANGTGLFVSSIATPTGNAFCLAQ